MDENKETTEAKYFKIPAVISARPTPAEAEIIKRLFEKKSKKGKLEGRNLSNLIIYALKYTEENEW